jgi:uncharacterized protein (DUF2164 family)
MIATKQYYLKLRSTFLQMGLQTEVKKLDNHFELVFITDKNGRIKKII